MSHTPTPWSDDFEKGNGQITQRASGMEIAVCSIPNDSTLYKEMCETRHDNAVLIVEAVNAHEKLKTERNKLRGAIGTAIDQFERDYTVAAIQTLKEALGLREAGKEKS